MDELHCIVAVAQFRGDLDLNTGFGLKAAAFQLFDAGRADRDPVVALHAGIRQRLLKSGHGKGILLLHAGAHILHRDGVIHRLVAYQQLHGGFGAAVKGRHIVQLFRLRVRLLHGGHSGNQALLERANAIILLDRLLLDLEEQSTFQLITAKGGREGGCMATAIAATASAIIAVPDTKAAETVLAASAEKLKKEYSVREPNMSIAVSPCEVETDAMTDGDREMLLDLMTLLPDGLRSTHQTFEHTLGSTSNVGVLETRQDEVELAVTIRSTDTKRFYNYQQLKRLCARLGVKTELICELPEWEYSVSDEWMEMLRKMYPEYPPYYLGGTGEIGFFTTRIPGLNAVSLTPNAFNCHSTQEYLSIRECRYFYDKMVELLEKMKDM